jgi:hypothetical protein
MDFHFNRSHVLVVRLTLVDRCTCRRRRELSCSAHSSRWDRPCFGPGGRVVCSFTVIYPLPVVGRSSFRPFSSRLVIDFVVRRRFGGLAPAGAIWGEGCLFAGPRDFLSGAVSRSLGACSRWGKSRKWRSDFSSEVFDGGVCAGKGGRYGSGALLEKTTESIRLEMGGSGVRRTTPYYSIDACSGRIMF